MLTLTLSRPCVDCSDPAATPRLHAPKSSADNQTQPPARASAWMGARAPIRGTHPKSPAQAAALPPSISDSRTQMSCACFRVTPGSAVLILPAGFQALPAPTPSRPRLLSRLHHVLEPHTLTTRLRDSYTGRSCKSSRCALLRINLLQTLQHTFIGDRRMGARPRF